jgi:SAM-dependent methyltransferase
MSDPRLQAHRSAWQRKSAVRKVYDDYHNQLLGSCVPGAILDVGSGSGHFREKAENVVAIDLLAAPWLNLVADAQVLPFSDGCFGSIVMLDVLHHIERPKKFFSEVARTLKKGGRLAMIEPAITPLSWFVYNFLHSEPVVLSVDPLADVEAAPGRDAFDANQAIPNLLFARERDRQRFMEIFPDLRVVEFRRLSLFAYPLSGGFKSWSLIPGAAVSAVLALERALLPLLGRWLAFRMLVVVERV